MSAVFDALVLFGPTGDLAYKKLFPALYELEARTELNVPVVGIASSDWTVEQLRDRVRASVAEHVEDADIEIVDRVCGRLAYVAGDYRSDDTWKRLADAVGSAGAPLAYLAIPPSLFETVIDGLDRIGAATSGGVVVEKPFGRDLASARQLNATLGRSYGPEQVFRIDHFLGKETTLDLLVFRMANSLFHPAWDRNHVESVQITMAERFGTDGRGRFYEEVGAIRDVVQNHLLQVLALVAMDPPIDTSAEQLQNEKLKVMRAMRTLDRSEVVRGQFIGYRDEEGVASDSDVETYVALRAWVDSWRWAGVPFHIRTGKSLAETATEVLVEFKPPARMFYADEAAGEPHPNHLRFRLKPGEGLSLSVSVKGSGDRIVAQQVDLRYEYDAGRDGRHVDEYARLLGDALEGDHTLFARADAVEEAWRIVDEVVADPPRALPYEAGSWGPDLPADAHYSEVEAYLATRPPTGWHDPLMPAE